MKKNAAIVVLSIALVLCVAVGGTLAYLTARTATITNTFTFGKIDLTLVETKQSDGVTPLNGAPWTAEIVPGSTYTKDPTVTIGDDSEACWVFVKIDDLTNGYVDWAIAAGWTELTGEDNVYYLQQAAIAKDADPVSYPVLLDNKVSIAPDVALDGGEDNVTLKFTAYACQKANVDDVADAWDAVKTLPNP